MFANEPTSSNGQYCIATISSNSAAQIWRVDLSARPSVRHFELKGEGFKKIVSSGSGLFALIGNDRIVVVSGQDGNQVSEYRITSTEEPSVFAVSADGKLLITGGEDGYLRVLGFRTGRQVDSSFVGAADDDTVLVVAADPSGRVFWATALGRIGWMQLQQVGKDQLRLLPNRSFDPPEARAQYGHDHIFLEESRRKVMFSGPYQGMSLYDVSTGARLWGVRLKLPWGVHGLMEWETGDVLIPYEGVGFGLWPPRGVEVRTLRQITPVWEAIVVPREQGVATIDASGGLTLHQGWKRDLVPGGLSADESPGRTLQIGASPDGKVLVSVEEDGVARVWRVDWLPGASDVSLSSLVAWARSSLPANLDKRIAARLVEAGEHGELGRVVPE